MENRITNPETETRVCKSCGRELPIEQFKVSRWGKRMHVCTECTNAKCKASVMRKAEQKLDEMSAAIQNARHLRIHDFTPRELMEELYRRGYEGTLRITETHTIDISNF